MRRAATVSRRLANTIGFDDAPFARDESEPVRIVGAVFAGSRFDGVLTGSLQKDGDDATDVIAELVARSRFAEHVQVVLLQGITFGGFNVVDLSGLHRRLDRPVVVVTRRPPKLAAVRNALLTRIPDGAHKWALIESAGPMERVGGVYLQRAGLSTAQAATLLERLAIHSLVPEPLRVAHLIAGGLGHGASRGRV